MDGLAERGNDLEFKDYINIAQILLSTLLTGVLLMQAKGAGIGTALGGGSGGSFRTRRGVEKTLFQLTIIIALVALIVSMIAVRTSLNDLA